MENETYWDIADRFEKECSHGKGKSNSSIYPIKSSVESIEVGKYCKEEHRKVKKVTFELPDNATAISMAIVTSDSVGATLITKSYGRKELDDGAVNEWVEPECREVDV